MYWHRSENCPQHPTERYRDPRRRTVCCNDRNQLCKQTAIDETLCALDIFSQRRPHVHKFPSGVVCFCKAQGSCASQTQARLRTIHTALHFRVVLPQARHFRANFVFDRGTAIQHCSTRHPTYTWSHYCHIMFRYMVYAYTTVRVRHMDCSSDCPFFFFRFSPNQFSGEVREYEYGHMGN